MKKALIFAAMAASSGRADELSFYIGTYTGGESKGIYASAMDPETGALGSVSLVAETPSPSFLALRPDGKFLYAVNEAGEGTLSAFAREVDSGKLTFLNSVEAGGTAPCHLVVDRSGANVLYANYGGGSVGVYRIAADGSLGERSAFVQHEGSSTDPQRQKGPHGHAIYLDAANAFAVACDLGLDELLVYAFDPDTGTLAPAADPSATLNPGSGPRHLAFHPDGKLGWALNEMTSAVTGFRYDPNTGKLSEIDSVSTLPKDWEGGSWTAEIFAHPGGKFLYASNRGHDSIAVFSIDRASGKLTPVQHQKTGGKTPRGFALAPGGKFLLAANQGSNTIVVFKIDPETGRLSETGHSASAPKPVCIEFVRP